ncbi:GDSL Lipase/Acylhydrolase family protein-like protein [Bisporella sp. PMI_857]|nr:GDSL Lipase/Acylhydrolase family protein-like protein [Bisporella sp. PMI_857]
MAEQKKYSQIILFGDSIIQYAGSLSNGGYNFGAGLAEHCSRRLDVINRGLSGYNSAQALKVLPDIIPNPSAAKVDYLLILFGANDACLPDCPTKQHIPLSEYRENLKKIITHPSVKAHNPTILLVTPPIVNEVHLGVEDKKKGFPEVSRRNDFTSQYATTVREIVAEVASPKLQLIDLWNALQNISAAASANDDDPQKFPRNQSGDSEVLRNLLVDGLHLTGDGYKIFLGGILPLVGPTWAQEPLEEPSWVFPYWTNAPQ